MARPPGLIFGVAWPGQSVGLSSAIPLGSPPSRHCSSPHRVSPARRRGFEPPCPQDTIPTSARPQRVGVLLHPGPGHQAHPEGSAGGPPLPGSQLPLPVGSVGGAASGPGTSSLALDPTHPHQDALPPMHRGPHVSSIPLSPQLWALGGIWDRGRDSPLPNHSSRTQECLCKEGRSWAFGKGGTGGAVREGFLEEVVPGRAPGHSQRAARCARHTRAASGRPPPAPTPAGPRSPPWTPAWKGEGRRGCRRGLLGAQPSAHGLSHKASPQQLTQQRAGSPGPASSLDSGVSPMGVAVTQVKGTHTCTHTQGYSHTRVHVHKHPSS